MHSRDGGGGLKSFQSGHVHQTPVSLITLTSSKTRNACFTDEKLLRILSCSSFQISSVVGIRFSSASRTGLYLSIKRENIMCCQSEKCWCLINYYYYKKFTRFKEMIQPTCGLVWWELFGLHCWWLVLQTSQETEHMVSYDLHVSHILNENKLVKVSYIHGHILLSL